MNSDLLDGLLYQAESATLDFKSEEYPFEGATDCQKSELLKDILAFANAWRESDAYILTGVQEVKGGRSTVRGIASPLLNRNLQQFVNSKTNRAIDFSYSTLTYEGGVVGVFEIAQQERPIYLLKDYGDTKANVVYIRRGDTTAQASPDEIARMGSHVEGNRRQPVLEFEFGNAETRETQGPKAELESISALLPPRNGIPLYGKPAQETPFSFPSILDSLSNRELYREVADYLRNTTYLCPVALVVNNPSQIVAEDATLNLKIPAQGISVLSVLPDKPSESMSSFHPGIPTRSAHRIEVSRFGDSFHVRAGLGNIQPGTSNWAHGLLYIGARNDACIEVEVQISANNLQAPTKSTARFEITTRTEQFSLKDLKQFVDREY